MKKFPWILVILALALSACTPVGRGLRSSTEQRTQEIRRAQALYDMGELEAAIANLTQVVDANPHTPTQDQAYELLIEWLLQTNKYEEAKRYASYFLKHYAKSPSAKKITALFNSPAIHEKLAAPEQAQEEEQIEQPEEGAEIDLDVEKKKSRFHEQQIMPLDPRALGILLPLSGPLAAFGKKALQAMTMALGIPMPVELQKTFSVQALGLKVVVVDSEGDAAKAMTMVKNLITQYHVAMIIGDITNDASLTAAQICQHHGVPLLSLSRHPLVADLGDYIFMFNSSHSQQLAFLVNYAMQTQGYKRFAILYPRHNYGITMAKAFFEAITQAGGAIAGLEAYDAHETTFTHAVKNLVGLYCTAQPCDERNLRPTIDFEALFIPEFSKLAYVIPALVQADILVTNTPAALKAYALATKIENPKAVQLLGLSSWNDAPTLQKLGPQANGAFFVDVVSFDDGPELSKFKQDWDLLGVGPPTTLEVLAYDALMLARTIMAKKMNSREDIRSAIANFSGKAALLKHLEFSPNGELSTPQVGFALTNGHSSVVISN